MQSNAIELAVYQTAHSSDLMLNCDVEMVNDCIIRMNVIRNLFAGKNMYKQTVYSTYTIELNRKRNTVINARISYNIMFICYMLAFAESHTYNELINGKLTTHKIGYGRK